MKINTNHKFSYLIIATSFIALAVFIVSNLNTPNLNTGEQKAQVGEINTINPRLFFKSNDLDRLRNDGVLVNKYKNYYKTLQPIDWGSSSILEIDKSTRLLNLAYNLIVLDPADPAVSAIVEQIKQGLLKINNGVWVPQGDGPNKLEWSGSNDVMAWYPGGVIQDYAIAYDLISGTGHLTGNDLQNVRSRLLLLASVEYRKLMNSKHVDKVSHIRIANMRFRSLAGVGMVALAIPDQNGDIPDPENLLGVGGPKVSFNSSEILEGVVRDLLVHDGSMPAGDDSGKGTLANYITSEGVFVEGHSYIPDSFNALVPFMAAYEHVTGQSFFRGGDLTDGRVVRVFDWVLKTAMPNLSFPTTDSGFTGNLILEWDLMAKYSDFSQELLWYFENLAGRSQTFYSRILSDLSGLQSKTPQFRTEFFEESGHAVFRDKWGNDATYMMFLAEHDPNRSYHEQADQTSFAIYAKDAYLAIDPGDGRTYGWSSAKEQWMHYGFGHNLILVDSYFSGDPTKTSTEAHPGVNYKFNSAKDPAYLQNSFADDKFDFSEARMTYSGVNVDLVRSMAFPRHQYFVVLDDLKASTDHEYKWQIHFGSSPETVSIDNLTGVEKSFTWTMKNTKGGQSSLDVDFLKGPESYVIKRDGPTEYDFKKTYDHTYIQAVSNKSNHTYLTILYPRYSTDPKLKIEELVTGKVWKISGSFAGYDIITKQDSSSGITANGITTDGVLSITSFNQNSEVNNVFVKDGTNINVQSGNKICSFSTNNIKAFNRTVNPGDSNCVVSSTTPTPPPLPDTTPDLTPTPDPSLPTPTPLPDATPTPTPTPPPGGTNGLCGTTLNSCRTGSYSDIEDTGTKYNWSCLGINGGYTATCSQNKYIQPPSNRPPGPISNKINYIAPTINIPTTTVDISMPELPSWLDFITAFVLDIANDIIRGVKRTGEMLGV